MQVNHLGPFDGKTVSCGECQAQMMAQGAEQIYRIRIANTTLLLCGKHVLELSAVAVAVKTDGVRREVGRQMELHGERVAAIQRGEPVITQQEQLADQEEALREMEQSPHDQLRAEAAHRRRTFAERNAEATRDAARELLRAEIRSNPGPLLSEIEVEAARAELKRRDDEERTTGCPRCEQRVLVRDIAEHSRTCSAKPAAQSLLPIIALYVSGRVMLDGITFRGSTGPRTHASWQSPTRDHALVIPDGGSLVITQDGGRVMISRPNEPAPWRAPTPTPAPVLSIEDRARLAYVRELVREQIVESTEGSPARRHSDACAAAIPVLDGLIAPTREIAAPPDHTAIRSGSDLDWRAALVAGQQIVKHASDAGFHPPEDGEKHLFYVDHVIEAIESITRALKLRKAPR